jgi:hypothetical protein
MITKEFRTDQNKVVGRKVTYHQAHYLAVIKKNNRAGRLDSFQM